MLSKWFRNGTGATPIDMPRISLRVRSLRNRHRSLRQLFKAPAIAVRIHFHPRMNIEFELATPADAEDLVSVQIAAFHDDARLHPGVKIGGPPGYDSVEAMLATIARGECHKVSLEGEIIGGITVIDQGGGHFHLDVLVVDPAHHNEGFGTQAMGFIEGTFPATVWTLDTPTFATRNQHFYERLGFVRVGETVFTDITLIQYEKKLT
jgi:GNAT superfamily N-acetyltransferase